MIEYGQGKPALEEKRMDDRYFMEQALALAAESAAEGEVPVGCVIVRGDEIVGRGRNRREKEKSALSG